MIGVTGWSFEQIARLTFPQLTLVLEGQGPILWPRLRPQLDHLWREVSEDGVKDILQRRNEVPDPERQKTARELAYKIHHRFYLGDVTEEAAPEPPIADLPPETARAVLAFARANRFPHEVYARDVAPHLRGLRATAGQEKTPG